MVTSTIAVALHGIEPATFERCATIREWLARHDIARVTLLVIPARDLHPLGERSPALIDWLGERRSHGDSIAQHGFQHARLRRGSWSRRLALTARDRRTAEFVGLDGHETRRAVEAGWRLLKLAGIEPDGFVAPAYAYTRALREALTTKGMLGARFRWWAGLLRVHGVLGAPGGDPQQLLAPAWDMGTEGLGRRLLSPTLIRAGGRLQARTLRLDLHPTILEHPRQVLALENLLDRVGANRRAITYDELAASLSSSSSIDSRE